MNVYNREDGVSVIEIDPSKKYWLVIPRDAGIDPKTLSNKDGLILIPRSRNHGISIIVQKDNIEICHHAETYFDRTLDADGNMTTVCAKCGKVL